MTQTLRTGTCTKEGFTLLELVVVLFIISLFAVTILPSFSRRESASGDAVQMASLLRELNDSSLTMQKSYWIKFDLDGRDIDWNGPDGERSMPVKTLSGLSLPSKGNVKDGTLTFFFDPGGALEDLKVRLRSENDAYTVYLNEMSGRVKVIEDTQ